MKILEGSDTLLTFKITENNGGTVTNVDLTEYDSVILTIWLGGIVLNIDGEIDGEDSSLVTFDIVSEQTANRCGLIQADIWGLKNEKKLRFNQETIQGEILHSVKVPEGATDL